MSCSIYIRVSTKEQDGNNSLTTQQLMCQELIAKLGMSVDNIYIDRQSGFNLNKRMNKREIDSLASSNIKESTKKNTSKNSKIRKCFSKAAHNIQASGPLAYSKQSKLYDLVNQSKQNYIVVAFGDRLTRNIEVFNDIMKRFHKNSVGLIVCYDNEKGYLFSHDEKDMKIITNLIHEGHAASTEKSEAQKRDHRARLAVQDVPLENYSQKFLTKLKKDVMSIPGDTGLKVVKDSYNSQRKLNLNGMQWTISSLRRAYNQAIDTTCCEACHLLTETQDNQIMICEQCYLGMHVKCYSKRHKCPDKYVCDECVRMLLKNVNIDDSSDDEPEMEPVSSDSEPEPEKPSGWFSGFQFWK